MIETSTRSYGQLIGIAAAVGLAGALGLAVAWQGWRSRIRGPQDWVLDVTSARAFVAHGHIPERGTVTSYYSYAPPGTAWSFVPGVLLFRDPRLANLPASILLYAGTLVGIFLLGRRYLGLRVATLAVVAYSLSIPALELASSPSARGHPFFYVGMVYCICRWVERSDSRYLAAGVLIWAAGMLVFLELAPAVLGVFAVWFFWRPPIRVRPLALAALLALLIWYPYLHFEATRRFVDIRSQVLRRNLSAPLEDRKSWCDPKSKPSPVAPPGGDGGSDLRHKLTTRLIAVGSGLVVNFDGPVTGTNLMLLLLTLAGLWLCLGTRPAPSTVGAGTGLSLLCANLVTGLMVLGLLASPGWMPLLDRTLQSDLPWLPRNVLLGLGWVAAAAGVFLARRHFGIVLRALAVGFHPPGDPRPLALALLVPWVVLLCIAEPSRVERFWWLGALQIVMVAVTVAAAAQGRRLLRWMGPVAMVALVAANPTLMARVDDWRRAGWPGTDAPEVQVADYLAARIHSAGTEARIGYPMPIDAEDIPSFETGLLFNGAIDLLLSCRGIANANQCAEGQSADDEYRVVDNLIPEPYLHVPSSGRLKLVRRFGHLEVYQRE